MQLCRFLVVVAALALSFAVPMQAQSVPEPIPGVHITNSHLPWAVDVYHGKQELVPIVHTEIRLDAHRGANLAGNLAGSFFYKPKMTTEIDGAHARVALHTGKPVFYVHAMGDPDSDSSDFFDHWAIVPAIVKKHKRVISQVRFNQLTGNAKRNDDEVIVTVEMLAGGWLKITPEDALTPGEYALVPVTDTANTFSTLVFDFTLDPNGPNAPDALSAPAPQESSAKLSPTPDTPQTPHAAH